MMGNPFRVVRFSRRSHARVGTLILRHGTVRTPAFMPIATQGGVKAVPTHLLADLGVELLLANTYHLLLRPGPAVVRRLGGLHGFLQWRRPILTDSGGYQVFSLAKIRTVTERGVRFRSPLDGTEHLLTPERAMAIQRALGSDIAMVLDELVGSSAPAATVQHAAERSIRWAARCRRTRLDRGQRMFGIVQGGAYRTLRRACAAALGGLGFDGYAVGGLAVGEPASTLHRVVGWADQDLPRDRVRYLMGVGRPDQLVAAVAAGMDMFDCVIPTRNARHGLLYVRRRSVSLRGRFWTELRISNAQYRTDRRPLDVVCSCPTCRGGYSRAYLHHLFRTGDAAASTLATLHNVRFFMELMEDIRRGIRSGTL